MTSRKIAIVHYGMGNIRSVANALDFLGGDFFVADEARALRRADAFILPGVGAFGAAMENLRRRGLSSALSEEVLGRRKPYLGICLGMQLLAEDSLEQGFFNGLGWIEGHILPLIPRGGLSVPHVGWNDLSFDNDAALFQGIDEKAHFYFDHSFYLDCPERYVTAVCDYGGEFVAAIQRDNIMAVQFHPEKSQRNGLKLLRCFLNRVGEETASAERGGACSRIG